MNAREERGLIIAAKCRLNRVSKDEWIVPSQSSGEKTYRVNLEKKSCTCPDCVEGGFTCKHQYAAQFTFQRDFLPNGDIIETKTVTFTEKKTYKQDWRAYNLAQSTEKHRFQKLLFDLTRGVAELPHHRNSGQQPHTTKDSLFAMTFKVFSTVSSRRFSCDLKDAHERGHTAKCIPGMKVPQFMENPALTPILKGLIAQSARPLRTVETKFAIDSSGFASSKFFRWFDEKYGVTRQKCEWVKTHICSGVKTNIVSAVRILDRDAADCPQFVPLVRETKKGFEISEVSADKAYASQENFEEIANMTWLNESTSQALVLGTLNCLDKLDSALESRFDEKFFVDLGTREEREAVATIWFKKKGCTEPEKAGKALADCTDGFSSREIEKLVKSVARLTNRKPVAEEIAKIAATVTPASKSQGDKLNAMRKAAGTLRRANSPEEASKASTRRIKSAGAFLPKIDSNNN